YMEQKLVDRSPFETIDKPGVGWLVRLAAWTGREAKPELKLGICGEHGGDPDSIDFFHMAGLDYVSCSPYRVPIARVAAAQGARALALNEDLTEAIVLGHDLGHPPFGHIGEEVLDACLQEHYGVRFRHNHHSLRVVERIEREGTGLNLTEAVRDGILRHTGPDLPEPPEGPIGRILDRL